MRAHTHTHAHTYTLYFNHPCLLKIQTNQSMVSVLLENLMPTSETYNQSLCFVQAQNSNSGSLFRNVQVEKIPPNGGRNPLPGARKGHRQLSANPEGGWVPLDHGCIQGPKVDRESRLTRQPPSGGLIPSLASLCVLSEQRSLKTKMDLDTSPHWARD